MRTIEERQQLICAYDVRKTDEMQDWQAYNVSRETLLLIYKILEDVSQISCSDNRRCFIDQLLMQVAYSLFTPDMKFN